MAFNLGEHIFLDLSGIFVTLEHLFFCFFVFFFFCHLSLASGGVFLEYVLFCMSDDGWDVCIETNATVNKNAPWKKYILSLDGTSEWAETVGQPVTVCLVQNTHCTVLSVLYPSVVTYP